MLCSFNVSARPDENTSLNDCSVGFSTQALLTPVIGEVVPVRLENTGLDAAGFADLGQHVGPVFVGVVLLLFSVHPEIVIHKDAGVADQITLLDEVVNYLVKNGVMEPKAMFDTPFTNINDQGMFGEKESKKIVETLKQINRNADVA